MQHPTFSPTHFLFTGTIQRTCQSCSPSSEARMHKSYSIPLLSRKLLSLTQTAPHPCTRVKNSTVAQEDKNFTRRLPTPAFLCSSSNSTSPFTGHKPKCLHICRSRVLPANSHQVLTRVGATEDESGVYFAQLFPLPLSTAHRPSSTSRR